MRARCRIAPPIGPVIEVEDEGVGIPRDSTGLGLAIARHVALTHAIRVQVEVCLRAERDLHVVFPPRQLQILGKGARTMAYLMIVDDDEDFDANGHPAALPGFTGLTAIGAPV